MTDRTKAAITGFVVGAAAGVLLGYTLDKLGGNEDRPPIIVKGGSLIFQSAKPWRQSSANSRQWQPNHPEGKETNNFQVMFIGGSGSCNPLFTSNATVTFKPDDAEAVTFTLAPEPEMDGGKSPAPTVEGPDLVQKDETGPAPSLVYDKSGEITQVVAGSSTCASPAGVIFRPLK